MPHSVAVVIGVVMAIDVGNSDLTGHSVPLNWSLSAFLAFFSQAVMGQQKACKYCHLAASFWRRIAISRSAVICHVLRSSSFARHSLSFILGARGCYGCHLIAYKYCFNIAVRHIEAFFSRVRSLPPHCHCQFNLQLSFFVAMKRQLRCFCCCSCYC